MAKSKWKVLERRNYTDRKGSTYRVVTVVCPQCGRKLTMRSSWVETHAACAGCQRSIPSLLARLTPEFKEKIDAKYAEHVRICVKNEIPPSEYEHFVLELSRDPELLDPEPPRAEPLLPSMASPLTWIKGD